MTDIGLFIVDGCINIVVENGEVKKDEGLETSVLISLFSDMRATIEEVGIDAERRGFWGDMFPEIPVDKLGSKLWLKDRSTRTLADLVSVETYADNSLKWMIEDGVAKSVSSVASFDENGNSAIILAIQIEKPDGTQNRFKVFWDEQDLKRA